ncbi:hypothetical protein SDC9_174769 [bioreactor metagenome]|uniref:Uncharacterized protein n=1 Tax=bioreactor metagenome TaxID=1076179 RepID=A0A645GK86_9ZZZZ
MMYSARIRARRLEYARSSAAPLPGSLMGDGGAGLSLPILSLEIVHGCTVNADDHNEHQDCPLRRHPVAELPLPHLPGQVAHEIAGTETDERPDAQKPGLEPQVPGVVHVGRERSAHLLFILGMRQHVGTSFQSAASLQPARVCQVVTTLSGFSEIDEMP